MERRRPAHSLSVLNPGGVKSLVFLEHEGQHILRYRRIPYRRERLAMQRRRPVFAQRGKMAGRAVALVRSQAIHGKDRVPFNNHAIAFDLGQNGCGGDRSGQGVAVNDRLLREFAVESQRIHQQMSAPGLRPSTASRMARREA